MLVIPAVIVFAMQGTVWDGVYTDAQAMRGKAYFEAHCSSCHRSGPAKADVFMEAWSGTSANSLFTQMKSSMPPGAPASLSDETYLEILAYVLQVNAFPAGDDDLTLATLRNIRIERKDGPEPAPNFALVQVAGCLDQDADGTWVLTHASEPVRTKSSTASNDDELTRVASTPLGEERFRLMNVYPRPDAYTGHRVEVKGLLIRNPDGNRLNVTSLQSLAPTCSR